MRKNSMIIAFIMAMSLFAGCTSTDGINETTASGSEETTTSVSTSENTSDSIKSEIVFTDNGITSSNASSAEVDGTAMTITKAGTYVLSGSCTNGSIKVKKGVVGVRLVLDGLSLTSESTAPVICGKSTEVTIEAADGTENTLADTENNNDENGNADAENAVIKCNDGSQVVICGTGTLNIQANGKNGIKSGSSTEEEGEASLTIQELTLNIDAQVNDAVNAEAALNVKSGNITITAGDDALHCDHTLNIGEDGTDGPVITINSCQEGLEGAEVNVYSGDIGIESTDDCINAANADLTGYDYTLNIFGGTINAHSTSGDGFDSNGDLTISGGNVIVWTESVADNEPLDADGTVTVLGGTVLAAGGSSGMGMNLAAEQPCVIFGGEGGAMTEPGNGGQNGDDAGAMMAPEGGSKPGNNSGTTVSPGGEEQPSGMKDDSQNKSAQPPEMKDNSQNSSAQNTETGSGSQAESGQGMETENNDRTGNGRMQEPGQGIAHGAQNSLISENSTFTITSSDGSVIYTADALCGASYVFYSSADLTVGEAYTLSSGESNTEATAQTGTVTSGRGGGQNNIG